MTKLFVVIQRVPFGSDFPTMGGQITDQLHGGLGVGIEKDAPNLETGPSLNSTTVRTGPTAPMQYSVITSVDLSEGTAAAGSSARSARSST